MVYRAARQSARYTEASGISRGVVYQGERYIEGRGISRVAVYRGTRYIILISYRYVTNLTRVRPHLNLQVQPSCEFRTVFDDGMKVINSIG